MRKLNTKYFDEYAAIHGRLWREELSVASKIPFELIDRGFKGKRRFTEVEVDSLCRVLGMSMDELFPVSKQEKSA
jgi:hypothetical protein